MTMSSIRFTPSQTKAINHSGANLLVAAAAGSGKTAVVAQRAVQLLVNGSGGDPFSLEDIRELLRDCGIRYERNFPTNLHHIIVGKNEPK